MSARLRLSRISKSFGATRALDDVHLEVRPGEVHGLVGENGAGKSTLMKILSGAVQPDSGEMWLDDEPHRPTGPADGTSAGVAMIYQELAIAPHLSVAENVMLGHGRGFRFDRRATHAAARRALERVGRADLPLDKPAGSLGIAEQQLIEIARACDRGARVLVLDEPTSSLSRPDAERLFELIRELSKAGSSVLYISHFLEEIRTITDRCTVLRDGSHAGTFETRSVDEAQLVEAMVGRRVEELYPRSKRTPGDPLVEMTDLVASNRAAAGSLTVRRGEVLGISGLVGSGRTELLRALFGLDQIESGDLQVLGLSGQRTPRERWASGAGYVSEDRKREGLAAARSIAENVALARLPSRPTPRRLANAIDDPVRALGVKCASTMDPVDRLSGGNQQKVAMARLLHTNADLLILDEPTRGIDIGSRAAIYRLIDDLARGRDGQPPRGILMVSSSNEELLGICDSIAVMHRGVLGASRPVDQWTEHDLMLAAAAGGST